jgi:hypothetical protein
MKFSVFTILSLLILFSCSSRPSRPQLYPNQLTKEKGQEASQKDIDECLKEAENYLQTPEGKKLKDSINPGNTSTSIGVGFGFGGGGTGVGLGLGTGRGHSRLSGEEQVRRNFTNQCLVNKGYQIVGWEN